MKYFLTLLLLYCFSGCKSDDVAVADFDSTRELTEEEKPLVGSYSNITGEQELNLALYENGYCELLQDGEKLDNKPMKWRIHKSEVSIQTQWFSKWKDLMYFRVQDNGDLKLVAEGMRSDNRIDLPKPKQTIFIRSND